MENPLWSRRGFLGMGVGVVGAAGLAACGTGSEAPSKVQAEVPKELVDAAVPLKGSAMGMLSQKLYSSAANAALDSVRSASFPTAPGDWFSAGIVSDGSYDIPAGLVYSYPLRSEDGKSWSIVQGLDLDADARQRIDASAQELIAERDAVKDLLGPAA